MKRESCLARLVADARGEASSRLLGTAVTWFVVLSVFMMNVQLGQLFHRRDVVDHAAAVAADTATKTYCAGTGGSAYSEQEALRAIGPLLVTASSSAKNCLLSVRERGVSADPGVANLDVSLECSFPCHVPLAAQAMCKDGKVSFSSRLKTVAVGCDGSGG